MQGKAAVSPGAGSGAYPSGQRLLGGDQVDAQPVRSQLPPLGCIVGSGEPQQWVKTMQLKQLRTFVAVASTLSLTRAGEKLHLAQSSVTEQIQALELDLGTALLDRSRRRLALTPAGWRLLTYASSILELHEEARVAVLDDTGRVAGLLTIGSIDSLCLERVPALLLEFCSRFPDVQVVLRSGKTVELLGSLRAGLLDVYFTFGNGIAGPDLRSEKLEKECPSSDDLRHIAGFRKGGSGSSVIKIMRHAVDAASDGLRLSGA